MQSCETENHKLKNFRVNSRRSSCVGFYPKSHLVRFHLIIAFPLSKNLSWLLSRTIVRQLHFLASSCKSTKYFKRAIIRNCKHFNNFILTNTNKQTKRKELLDNFHVNSYTIAFHPFKREL